jgi:phenylacetic acid degradation operon negative regulatory protein
MGKAISVSRRRDAWIRRVLAADPPRAMSLIVTVWGDAIAPASRDGGLWLAALIQLMAPFGINERLVRTSVFRLAREGWVVAASRGRQSRYRLTPAGRARFAEAYTRIYTPHAEPWAGGWQVVVLPPEVLAARARTALRNELAWAGFGQLAPGVHVRPRDGAMELRTAMPATRGHIATFSAHDHSLQDARSLAQHVDALWNLPELARRYRRFLQQFGTGIDLFRASAGADADPAQAFVARTLLIHAFRRVLLRDPLLPGALLPLGWPGVAA